MESQPSSPQIGPMDCEDLQDLKSLSVSTLQVQAVLSGPERDEISQTSKQEAAHATCAVLPSDASNASISDTIKILVGPLHTVFRLHRIRICAISPYFATNLASPSTIQVILPDIEPSIFQLVVDWLHNGRLAAASDDTIRLDQLIDIYLFGDLISCRTLKNHAMDLIQDNMYRHLRKGHPRIKFSLNQIRRIFAGTLNADDAPLRIFVAALVSYRLIFGDTPERLEPIFEVPGFLRDFAAFQRESLRVEGGAWYGPVSLREDPRIRGLRDVEVARKGFHVCAFHVHEKGEKCSSRSNYKMDGGEEDVEGDDAHQGLCMVEKGNRR